MSEFQPVLLANVADDVETLQLPQKVWEVIEHAAETAQEPPKDHVVCPYCNTANEIGVLTCPQCGGSLSESQPRRE